MAFATSSASKGLKLGSTGWAILRDLMIDFFSLKLRESWVPTDVYCLQKESAIFLALAKARYPKVTG